MTQATHAERPTVSVVVATRDRPASLRAALEAVTRCLRPGDEVVVADSASTGDLTRSVAEAAGARYLRCDVPGASFARNRGAQIAGGDVLAFTDDDCRPRLSWLDELAAPYADQRIGVVTGTVVGAGRGSAADTHHLRDLRWEWPADPAEMGSGASMSVRRQAFDEIGGFDERLGPGATVVAAEDHELFLRLLWAGWVAAVAPGAVVDHHDERSRWDSLRLFYQYGLGAGALCAMCRSLDRGHARRLLWRRVWTSGIRLAIADLARARLEASARAMAMSAGALVGRVRSRQLRSRSRRAPSPETGESNR